MIIESSTSALFGMAILSSVFFATYRNARKRRQQRNVNPNKRLVQEIENLTFMLEQAQKEVKIGSWEWNTQSNEVFWSDEMYSIYDLPQAEGPAIEKVRNMILEEDRVLFDQVIEESISGKIAKKIEYRINTPTGEIKYIAASGQAFFDDDQKPKKIFGTAQDITVQKEVSKSLYREKKKYHLLTENLPVGIFRSNVKGELLFVNQAMVEMFGYSSEKDLLEQNSTSLYNQPEDRDRLINELHDKGKLTDFTMTFIKQDGSTFIGEQNSLIEGNELHGIVQNITDRVKNEEEKTQLIKTLKSQNQDLEEFAFIISHYLRSPLSNMMGLTKIFDKSAFSPDNLEVLSLIEQSTTNLDLIIKDLNQTLTVREGNNKIREEISLRPLLNEIIAKHTIAINASKITLETNICSGDKLNSVPLFVKNIIEHLLDNAIKFQRQTKGRKIEINFNSEPLNDTITVIDNGIGIDLAANFSKIFLIYEKLNENIEGRGLGLYLVKNHLNALGGDIQIESKLNIGSKFTVLFPKETCHKN